MPDSLICLQNYSLLRTDRVERKCGGVCIFIKENISINKTEHINIGNEIEGLVVNINLYQHTFNIACFYKPPDTSINNNKELVETILKLSSLKNLIITGDFNYPEICWNSCTMKKNDERAQYFLDEYINSNLTQFVKFPTRFRSNNEPSVLDLILSNDEKLITELKSSPPIGISDHICLTANIQLSRKNLKSTTSFIRNYKAAKFDDMRNFLETHISNFEGNAENFYNIIDIAIDKYVPLKQKRKNKFSAPWMNNRILRLINRKRRLWDIYKISKLTSDYDIYKTANNEVTKEIRECRHLYEESLLSSSKKFFNYIGRTLSSQLKSFTLKINETDNPTSDPNLIANHFAEYFESVYSPLETDEPANIPRDTFVEDSITTVEITVELVQKAILEIKTDASPGPDHIHAIFLKECREQLAEPLCGIMTESLKSGKLPSQWKKAIVVPIYKKGSKLDVRNYRPISLTSILCKIMEKLIARELTEFFNSHDIIPKQQHGFMPGRSTTSNLLKCMNDWTLEFDEGNSVDVLYIDFEKAFDKVPISSLLHKLKHYGVRGQLLSWITDFLTNRTFQVRIGDKVSEETSITSGVPQGSVLGPLLFLLYTCDLPTGMSSKISLFADDAKLYNNPLINQADLQNDLIKLEKWATDWKMIINASKCSVLHIGKTNPQAIYLLNGVQVRKDKSARDLGVTITSDLKWEVHIAEIVKKANKVIYMIKKTFKKLSINMFLKIYKVYIRPIVEYCHVVWSPYFVKDIEKIEQVQRRASKLPNILRLEDYPTRIQKLHLSTLYDRRKRGDLIECFKIINDYYNCNFETFFHKNYNTHLRGHSKKLNFERCALNPRKNFIVNRVVCEWNALNEYIISAPNKNIFKNRLDRDN